MTSPATPTYIAAIDLGGTKIASGLVECHALSAKLLTKHSTPTPHGAVEIVATVIELVAKLRSDLAELNLGELSLVGIGSAGVVDPSTGTIVDATDAIPGWKGTRLGSEVARATGLPTFVDNDVHAHARGEMWLGAGANLRDFALVAVGTGVGITIVLDGRIRTGQHRLAGNGAAIEHISSGPAIAAAYNTKMNTDETLRDIAARLETDPEAKSAIEHGATHLGAALGHLVNTIDPEALILGGGVADIGPAWFEPMRTAFRATAHPALADTPLITATLGNDAALLGAAHIALQASHP